MDDFRVEDIKCHKMLSPEGIDKVKSILSEVHYPKGHLLIGANKYERDAYIIKKGIIRSYIIKDGKDISFWFARECDIISSSVGYALGKKGYENYELLEDSILYHIDVNRLKEFYKTDLEIANWSRSITELEAIKAEQRFLSYMFTPPLERYLDLLENDAELLQRVPLKDIASYIGISAVSLSRIRARIK